MIKSRYRTGTVPFRCLFLTYLTVPYGAAESEIPRIRTQPPCSLDPSDDIRATYLIAYRTVMSNITRGLFEIDSSEKSSYYPLLRRRYIAQLSLAAWRGYANLVLEWAKYIGTGRAGTIKAEIMQDMLGRADACENVGMWTSHEARVA